ncbi:MAG: hypothetical protein K8U57_20430 [Planctomycetes bacterium]|nr:hypothetical protein [Planctomycetota bacterium]
MIGVVLAACLQVVAQPAPAPDSTLVHSIREIAGHSLHHTSQCLDLLSEPRIFWLLESDELAGRIRSAVRAAEEIDKQLAKIAALKGLSKEDSAGIARLRKIADLLKQEGELLQAYWDSGVIDRWKESEAAGKKARKELTELLDLNPKTGIAPPPREPGKKP